VSANKKDKDPKALTVGRGYVTLALKFVVVLFQIVAVMEFGLAHRKLL